jgi:diguanylate cyclase (GGDEF)-like protein
VTQRFPAPAENTVPRVDHLTGLANRRAWYEAIDREDARSRRRGLDASVVLVQLSHLAQVNSVRGTRAADALLRRTSKVLSSLARGEDTLARVSDDTFGLLLTDCGESHARVVVDRLSTGLALANVEAIVAYGTRGSKDDLAAVTLAVDADLFVERQARLAPAGLRRVVRAQAG